MVADGQPNEKKQAQKNHAIPEARNGRDLGLLGREKMLPKSCVHSVYLL